MEMIPEECAGCDRATIDIDNRLVLQHDGSVWTRSFPTFGEGKPDHTTILVGNPGSGDVASFGRIVMSRDGMKAMEPPGQPQFDIERFLNNEFFKIEGIKLDPAPEEEPESRVKKLIKRIKKLGGRSTATLL